MRGPACKVTYGTDRLLRRAGRSVLLGTVSAAMMASAPQPVVERHPASAFALAYGEAPSVFLRGGDERTACAYVFLDDANPAPSLTDGYAYFDRMATLPVRIAGTVIDVDATYVQDASLRDLLSAGAFCEVGPTEGEGEEVLAYEGEILLDEGQYELASLVWVDASGEEQGICEAWLGNDPVERIMVDKTAPHVEVQVCDQPARTERDEDGDSVAFYRQVDLCIQLQDAYGVEDVWLEGIGAQSLDLRVSDDKTEATLSLRDSWMDAQTFLVAQDHAGNAYRWSLAAFGEAVTAEGASLVANAPVVLASDGSLLCDTGHPRILIADSSAPELAIEGLPQRAVTAHEQEVTVAVRDANIASLVRYGEGLSTLRVWRDGMELACVDLVAKGVVTAPDTLQFALVLPVSPSHEDDGWYTFEVEACDLSGNQATPAKARLLVDTTPPELGVTFTNGEDVAGKHFAHPLAARVEIRDRGLTLADLNASDAPVRLRVDASKGALPADVIWGAWEQGTDEGVFMRTLSFPADGLYELHVVGTDLAGNALVGLGDTLVDGTGAYASGAFTIDTQAPQIELAYARGTANPVSFQGVDYFRSEVTLDVCVTDRNFDQQHTTVTDSQGSDARCSWDATEVDDGRTSFRTSLRYTADSATREDVKNVVVRTKDLAGNESLQPFAPFVVDRQAPQVTAALVTEAPSFVGGAAQSDAPTLFFGGAQAQSPALVVKLADDHLLDCAWVEDPAHAYDLATDTMHGRSQGEVRLALKEGVAFGEDVRLYARDMAGNVTAWSLATSGVPLQAGSSPAVGEDVHPQALVFDATPAHVGLAGAVSGAYYARPLTVNMTVGEQYFAELAQFDPLRVLAAVRRATGEAGDTRSSWTISAHQFYHEGDSWEYDLPIDADGTYWVDLQVTDCAGNESEAVSLLSFTLDTTAPSIQVSWDNTDARNGRYYAAARTATVRVAERNFDPSLVDLRTTGQVGAWEDEGDIHTVRVAFLTDASIENPHCLEIKAKDLAGNEAVPYVEQEFAIDTQAPIVSLLRRTSTTDAFVADGEEQDLLDGSAFAGAFAPSVLFADDASFDPAGIELSLVGTRSAERLAFEPTGKDVTKQSLTVSWGNLGLVEGEVPRYDLAADDVYVLTAKVTDLAGNESKEAVARFSLNRYGSNFYVERVGSQKLAGGDTKLTEPLVHAPEVVIHEVNVSGPAPQVADGPVEASHVVTKEHAYATKEIPLGAEDSLQGFHLRESRSMSEYNPHEGWTELTYVIHAGNFGKGSDSDYGDGAQGNYVVSVSSVDGANNSNTLASFWSSEPERENNPQAKDATVSFTLDELGPAIRDLQLPLGLCLGKAFEASFYVEDDITQGDYVRVLVDGMPVEVRRADTHEPLGSDEAITRSQELVFTIPARFALANRSVQIEVSDYTGMAERVVRTSAEGFRVSTLVGEGTLALVGVAVLLAGVRWGRPGRRGKEDAARGGVLRREEE